MVIWRRWVFPILLLLVFGAIAVALVRLAFFSDATSAAVVPQGQVADPIVAVERGDVVNELTLSGTIARDESVAVRAEVDGEITEVHVADGADVAAGQPLLTIKRADNGRSIDVVAAEAGRIGEIAVVKGQFAALGAELATLTPARYHVLATVESAQLYRLVNAPTEGTVTITGGPAPFTCSGARIQVAQEGTTSVRCDVPTDQLVFAGLPATLDLEISTVTDALVVPTTAVKGGAGTGLVWIDDGTGAAAQERTVTLGVNDGTTVEVTEGLVEGELIRQYVPGIAADIEQSCYIDEAGNEFCDTGSSW